MKKIFLLVVVFTCINNNYTQAQTNSKSQFSFCNGTKDVIKLSEFDTCLELLSLDKNLIIESYTISCLVTNEKGSAYADYPIKGSKPGKDVIADLKKWNPEKILIEQVKAADNTGVSKKYPGLVLYVK